MWREQPILVEGGWAINAATYHWDILIPSEPDILLSMSVQVNWTGVTGTLNGTLLIQYSLDGSNWNDFSEGDDIDTANGSALFEVNNITARHIRILFTRNNISAGNIEIFRLMRRVNK